MKQYLILLSAFVLTQCHTVEDSNPFGKDAEELLVPLLKEFHELKQLMNEVKQYQKTQKITPLSFAERLDDTPFIEAWDEDACNKLTETLKQAADLAENITDWLFHAGLTLGKKIIHLINCAHENPNEAMQCAMNDISDIKDTIESYKPLVHQFKNDVYTLGTELREELKECLRVKKNA